MRAAAGFAGLICKQTGKCLRDNVANPIRIDSPTSDKAVHHEAVGESHQDDGNIGDK